MIEEFSSTLSSTPYSLTRGKREPLLLEGLNKLSALHYKQSVEYQRIVDGFFGGSLVAKSLAELPYLPVSLFKTLEMRSVPEADVRVTLTSSGTSGQAVSRIFLDKETSLIQQKALANSLMHVLGKKRLPMLVIDTDAVFRNPAMMSARGAGVLGLMKYGRTHAFALDENLNPKPEVVREFLGSLEGEPFFMFGFTFVTWLHFYEAFKDEGFDLSQGILIHSGGWKKMIERAVDNEEYRASFKSAFGLENIYNFYGLVEQIGSIFLEGPDGLLHPPNFADVIIRDPETWEPLENGKEGVIQLVSLLPHSYPGHSVLTEDLGVIESEDCDLDGWNGKGLRILGRVPRAELRGCSDVVAQAA